MVDPSLPLYQHPQETWDAKKCEKIAKATRKDGMGTPYGFKGSFHYGDHNSCLTVRYNGGCVREDEWYQGEQWHLPKVPDNFEIVHVPTWGWRMVKKPH